MIPPMIVNPRRRNPRTRRAPFRGDTSIDLSPPPPLINLLITPPSPYLSESIVPSFAPADLRIPPPTSCRPRQPLPMRPPIVPRRATPPLFEIPPPSAFQPAGMPLAPSAEEGTAWRCTPRHCSCHPRHRHRPSAATAQVDTAAAEGARDDGGEKPRSVHRGGSRPPIVVIVEALSTPQLPLHPSPPFPLKHSIAAFHPCC